MQLRFVLNIDDYVTARLEILRQQRRFVPSYLTLTGVLFAVLFVSLYSVIYILAIICGREPPWLTTMLIISAIIAPIASLVCYRLCYSPLIPSFQKKFLLSQIRRESQSDQYFTELTVSLAPEGIALRTSAVYQIQFWHTLLKITQADDRVLIWCGRQQAIVIPLDRTRVEGDPIAFVNEFQRQLQLHCPDSVPPLDLTQIANEAT